MDADVSSALQVQPCLHDLVSFCLILQYWKFKLAPLLRYVGYIKQLKESKYLVICVFGYGKEPFVRCLFIRLAQTGDAPAVPKHAKTIRQNAVSLHLKYQIEWVVSNLVKAIENT